MAGKTQTTQIVIAIFVVFIGTFFILSSNHLGISSITGHDVFIAASPQVNNVILNSTFGTNKTNENITVYWNSTDPENDSIVNITDWRLNGTSISLLNAQFENSSSANISTRDYSTYNRTLEIHGATWNRTGHIGGAYQFDNSYGDFINVSAVIKSLPVTYGGWINFDNFACSGGACTMILQDNAAAGGFEISTGFGATNNLACWDGAANTDTFSASANVWYFVLCKHNGTKMSLYVNGQVVGTPTSSIKVPPSSIKEFRIGPGDLYGSPNFGFQGFVDGVVVYNQSLNDTQILALYNNRTDLITSPLLKEGNIWQAAITPNDKASDGVTVLSNNLTVADSTPPKVSNLNYFVTNQTSTISWDTNESTNSSISFGSTAALGNTSVNSSFVTKHSIYLVNLTNSTMYFYNMTSCDALNNCRINETLNFTTLPNGCITPSNGDEVHYSGTFCPGTYNFLNGINFKSSNSDLTCNNSIFTGNFSSLQFSGFTIRNLTNVSIRNCNIMNYARNGVEILGAEVSSTENSNLSIINNTIFNISIVGISLGFSENSIVENNTINFASTGIEILSHGGNRVSNNYVNSSGGSVGILETSITTKNNIVFNNYVFGYSTGLQVDLPGGYNGSIFNNTLVNNSIGMFLQNTYNNTVANNTISNSSSYGIEFTDTSGNILIRNNISNSGTSDIFTSSAQGLNTLIFLIGDNEIKVINTIITVVSQKSGIFIGNRIISVNSSAEPNLNVSAEVVFTNLTSTLTPDIYRISEFSNNSENVVANGSVCPDTICTNLSFNSSLHTLDMNVTGFSSYAIKENFLSTPKGSGGSNTIFKSPSSSVMPEIQIPLQPAAAPVIEAPSAVPLSFSSFACLESGKSILPKTGITSLESSPYYDQVKRTYDVLVPAFKVDCGQSSFKLTFSLPDSYSNVTALRCSGSTCQDINLNEIDKITCGAPLFKDIRRVSSTLEPAFFPIELNKVQGTPGISVLQSSRTSVKFIGDVKGKVELDKLFGPAQEPKNTRIQIVGTPTTISFESQQNIGTNITLPYSISGNVDESSISIFAFKNGQWIFVGGNVDKNTKTVSASIKDISQFTENNKLTLAPMGILCLNCIKSTLDEVYSDGSSRNAVILIHGFENTPERFEDVINDIKMTNQPWQVWTYGYPSARSIDENAKALADLLQLHSDEYDSIYIAAHSLGGLVAQQALSYAYQQNQGKNTKPYTFVDKVVKVVSVAVPNKGVLTMDAEKLLNILVNSESSLGLFNINSASVQELIGGKEIPRVPGIEYLVVAGTEPYGLTNVFNVSEVNDGIVTLSSAQTIGGDKVNNLCSNIWEIDTTHTDLLNNVQSRKIIERIVAKEILKSIQNKAVVGYNQYYDMDVNDCKSDDQYIVVGVKVPDDAQPNPGMCSCGNKVCGLDENEINCPSDCAKIEKPAFDFLGLILRFKPLRYLAISLILVILGIVALAKMKRHETLIPTSESHMTNIPKIGSDFDREDKLNQLIIQARSNLRLGNNEKASVLYATFTQIFDSSSLQIKENFENVASKLKDEMKTRLGK